MSGQRGRDTKTGKPASSAPFGGRRAAPFAPGGGRKQESPRTADGKPRQRGGRGGK